MLVKAFFEDYDLKFRCQQIEGPASPRDYLDWNARLRKWRLEQLAKKGSNTTSTYDVSLEVSFIQDVL
jgi:hypothetical protein